MKSNFIKSTIILLIGGLLTKVLSVIIKIIMTRKLGIETLSMYMIILPTFSLAITLGQIGLPIALSRLVALNDKNNKILYFSIIPITLVIKIYYIILKYIMELLVLHLLFLLLHYLVYVEVIFLEKKECFLMYYQIYLKI